MNKHFTIEYWPTGVKEFSWHAKAKNGNVLFFDNQGYRSKATMLRLIKKWFGNVKVIELDLGK